VFEKLSATNNLDWLQQYYLSLCNGDWEHSYGFNIGNLDNPGWQFIFELTGTCMENVAYEAQNIHRSEHDWIFSRLEDKEFRAYCGPLNLDEVISVFRIWVETAGSEEVTNVYGV
jgi:hypothetical protein